MKIDCIDESHNIVDIVHGVIPYSGLEALIIQHPIFVRLQRLLQSSLAYLTYPSNKVHRFEHSFGVMHLAGIYFFSSICNSDSENIYKLFQKISEDYVSYPDCRLYREYTPSNISQEQRFIYYVTSTVVLKTAVII